MMAPICNEVAPYQLYNALRLVVCELEVDHEGRHSYQGGEVTWVGEIPEEDAEGIRMHGWNLAIGFITRRG